MQKSTLGFVVAAAAVVVVSTLAYAHALPTGIAPGNTDKIFHFAMGGILAFFLDAALRRRPAWSSRFAPPLSSVLILIPLALDEYLQRFSPARSSSIWDFAADTAGVIVLTLASRKLLAVSRVEIREPGGASRPRPRLLPRS